MGQTLSEPITAKETACVENGRFKVGSSSMQGWRVTMEDAHTHILSLPDDPSTAFFGVYDGHGGAKIAMYAGKHLHKYIISRSEYKRRSIEESIKQGFLDCDQAMTQDANLKDDGCGTTAVTVLIQGNTLYCGNVGDSRAVASINGRAEDLSVDHKPNNDMEFRRITAAGGFVELNRVNGNLALSRALGDYAYKRSEGKPPEQQIVTALPDVVVREVTGDWEFIILACDGIWDVLTSQETVNFVRRKIGLGLEPEEVCEALLDRCLAPDCQMGGIGCDNMTAVLVCFLHGGKYDNLVRKCAGIRLAKTEEVKSTNHMSINPNNSNPGSPTSPSPSSSSGQASPPSPDSAAYPSPPH